MSVYIPSLLILVHNNYDAGASVASARRERTCNWSPACKITRVRMRIMPRARYWKNSMNRELM